MKKTLKKFLAFVMAVCIVGSMTTAYAATDASAYLSSYRAACTAKSGCMIAVTVEVDGAGIMEDIGAAQIHVYRSADNKHFDFLRTFDSEDFPAMMDHNTDWYYTTPITFLGLAGYYYYANVEVYAGKDGGSSTRTYMTASVQARN